MYKNQTINRSYIKDMGKVKLADILGRAICTNKLNLSIQKKHKMLQSVIYQLDKNLNKRPKILIPDRSNFDKSLVILSRCEQVQAQLSQALYRIGELEGQLKTKEELIAELRERIKELKARPSKKWWEFWR